MKRPCNVLVLVRDADGQQMWYAGVLPAGKSESQVHVEQQEGAFRPIVDPRAFDAFGDPVRGFHAASPPPALKVKVTLAHERTQGVGPVPTKFIEAFAHGNVAIPQPPSVVRTKEGDSFTVEDWPTESELELLVRAQVAKTIGDRSDHLRGKRARPAATKAGRKK